jgi:O-antigen/teichoic acid export membrane protein
MSLASRLGNRFKIEFLGQAVVVLSGALLTVALAQLLGADSYGLFSLALSVLWVAQIFSRAGIAKSAARYVAEYRGSDPGQIPHLLKYSFFYLLTVILLVSSVMAAGHRYFASLIGEPDLAPLLLVGVLLIIFATLKRFSRIVLQGFEAIRFGAVIHATDRGLRLIVAITLVSLGYGALGALLGYVIAFAITSAVGIFYIYIKFYRGKERSPVAKGLSKRILRYAFPLTATSTGNVIDRRMDTILIGFYLGPVSVAYYAITKQIVGFIKMPVDALGFTLAPTYKSQQAKGNSKTATRIYEEALSHGLLVYIPAAAGLALIAEPLIRLIFGQQYLGAVPVLRIMVIYALMLSISTLTSDALDYLGHARERAIIRTTSAFANVFLNIILIPRIGVEGAAIATVVTYSAYTLATVYLMLSELTIRATWLFRSVLSILFVTSAMSVVVFVLIGYVESLLTLLLVVSVGVLVWAVLSMSLGLLNVREVVSVVQ